MTKERYRSEFVQSLKDKTEVFRDDIRMSEWKIAVYALFFSLCVITAKVFVANRKLFVYSNLIFMLFLTFCYYIRESFVQFIL